MIVVSKHYISLEVVRFSVDEAVKLRRKVCLTKITDELLTDWANGENLFVLK